MQGQNLIEKSIALKNLDNIDYTIFHNNDTEHPDTDIELNSNVI